MQGAFQTNSGAAIDHPASSSTCIKRRVLALYQGTTSVVPPPAEISGLQPLPAQNMREVLMKKSAGAYSPGLSCRLYGTTKVVP
jgi:hypothetical protein